MPWHRRNAAPQHIPDSSLVIGLLWWLVLLLLRLLVLLWQSVDIFLNPSIPDNNIGNDGIEVISQSLTDNNTLTSIELERLLLYHQNNNEKFRDYSQDARLPRKDWNLWLNHWKLTIHFNPSIFRVGFGDFKTSEPIFTCVLGNILSGGSLFSLTNTLRSSNNITTLILNGWILN